MSEKVYTLLYKRYIPYEMKGIYLSTLQIRKPLPIFA